MRLGVFAHASSFWLNAQNARNASLPAGIKRYSKGSTLSVALAIGLRNTTTK